LCEQRALAYYEKLKPACVDSGISYEDCVDPALFGALDEVVVQPGGGHCAAFRADPTLARRVREWALRRGI